MPSLVARRILLAPNKGVPVPPYGFVFMLDDDGQLMLDDDGTPLIEEI